MTSQQHISTSVLTEIFVTTGETTDFLDVKDALGKQNGLSFNVIIGFVVSAVIVLILAVFIAALLIVKRKKRRHGTSEQSVEYQNSSTSAKGSNVVEKAYSQGNEDKIADTYDYIVEPKSDNTGVRSSQGNDEYVYARNMEERKQTQVKDGMVENDAYDGGS